MIKDSHTNNLLFTEFYKVEEQGYFTLRTITPCTIVISTLVHQAVFITRDFLVNLFWIIFKKCFAKMIVIYENFKHQEGLRKFKDLSFSE